MIKEELEHQIQRTKNLFEREFNNPIPSGQLEMQMTFVRQVLWNQITIMQTLISLNSRISSQF